MTDPPTPARGRGRPRDLAKREALLDAGTALFLRDGAGTVTMDQIVAAAGVSRATLYGNFADKGALLAAVIARQSRRIATDAWARDNRSADLETALIVFGTGLLRFLAEDETFAFERLIGQAARAEPRYGAEFFAAGPGRARAVLTDLITAGQERGVLRAADPRQAANDLMGLWQGFWRIEVMYGDRAAPGEDEVRELARHGVNQFLRLYRPKGGDLLPDDSV